MSIIEINWNPPEKHLRDFARIGVVAFALVGAILYWVKDVNGYICGGLAIAGVIIFILSLLSLKTTRWIYVAFTALTFPIGLIISFFIMAFLYFLIITPIGIFFRIIGRDALRLKHDGDAHTYWQPYNRADDSKRYFNQF